jgi:flagellar basal body-associated protein FliL
MYLELILVSYERLLYIQLGLWAVSLWVAMIAKMVLHGQNDWRYRTEQQTQRNSKLLYKLSRMLRYVAFFPLSIFFDPDKISKNLFWIIVVLVFFIFVLPIIIASVFPELWEAIVSAYA